MCWWKKYELNSCRAPPEYQWCDWGINLKYAQRPDALEKLLLLQEVWLNSCQMFVILSPPFQNHSLKHRFSQSSALKSQHNNFMHFIFTHRSSKDFTTSRSCMELMAGSEMDEHSLALNPKAPSSFLQSWAPVFSSFPGSRGQWENPDINKEDQTWHSCHLWLSSDILQYLEEIHTGRNVPPVHFSTCI